ncbi:thrombospondin type 3 repeat-containing protein [bacterium]|nr:thrombospondin type 3 repeat-containing protein [bacterium]
MNKNSKKLSLKSYLCFFKNNNNFPKINSFFILLMLVTILLGFYSCDSNGGSNPNMDIRTIPCENIKPENSHWSDFNENGMITQMFDGESFVPPADSCGWICDEGFIRNYNSCIFNNGEITDSDSDSVPDNQDNCLDIYNPDQLDFDSDTIGDLCDSDIDGDGIDNETDFCPYDKYDNCLNWGDDDEDGIIDEEDNCPEIYNPEQNDLDEDGIGDFCDDDIDGDTILNDSDNCPNVKNSSQEDFNNDGVGDACVPQLGTTEYPFIIDTKNRVFDDTRDTNNSSQSTIDSYPPNTLNEGGKEYVYGFKLEETSYFEAWIDERQQRRDDVDIDLQLLSSIEPITLIVRDDLKIERTLLQPGVYYFTADSYVKNGVSLEGEYWLKIKIESIFDGTFEDPIDLSGKKGINTLSLPFEFSDSRTTATAISNIFTNYSGYTNLNEGGKEYIYRFTIDREARVAAMISKPEPDGVDIDIHLLGSLRDENGTAVDLISRGDFQLYARLQPGTYYIIADSYNSLVGAYTLNVSVRPIRGFNGEILFNDYIMEAIHLTDFRYRLLGYDSDWLTHDKTYGDQNYNDSSHYGSITRLKTNRTMCVAAVWEIMLTAMELYIEDTGDYSVYNYLTLSSWKTQSQPNIKGHIWVNHSYSHGSADAVSNFGMGEHRMFWELTPGSLLGITRSTGTGHAVVFVAFIDKWGFEYDIYDESREIIGFKYYSSQGGYDEGNGGMDYRYAIFKQYHTSTYCDSNPRVCDSDSVPIMPYKRDLNIYYHNEGYCQSGTAKVSDSIDLDRGLQLCRLNTGVMFSPTEWSYNNIRCDNVTDTTLCGRSSKTLELETIESFNSEYFDGVTYDDDLELKR